MRSANLTRFTNLTLRVFLCEGQEFLPRLRKMIQSCSPRTAFLSNSCIVFSNPPRLSLKGPGCHELKVYVTPKCTG